MNLLLIFIFAFFLGYKFNVQINYLILAGRISLERCEEPELEKSGVCFFSGRTG